MCFVFFVLTALSAGGENLIYSTIPSYHSNSSDWYKSLNQFSSALGALILDTRIYAKAQGKESILHNWETYIATNLKHG